MKKQDKLCINSILLKNSTIKGKVGFLCLHPLKISHPFKPRNICIKGVSTNISLSLFPTGNTRTDILLYNKIR